MTTPIDPRITPSVLERLRKMPARTREAILVMLGMDRTRPPTRPPYTRPPQRPPPTTGDWPVTTKTWQSDWDMYRLSKENVGISFTATGPTTGMGGMVLLADYGMVHQGYRITDCLVQIAPMAFRQWGARCYDVVDWIISRTKVIGPGQEHGLYLNAPGGFTIEDCYFSGWGGAGVQIAFRKVAGQYANESTDPMLASHPSKHIYRRVTIENCGHPESDRFGAYLISEHAAEIDWEGYVSKRINADVLIEDSVVRGGNLDIDYKGKHIRSTRGVLCQERPSLTILRSTVDVPEPMEDWNCQVWNVDHVVLDGSTFNGGWVEIRNAKSVRIVNCKGTAKVRIGTGGWNVFPMPNVAYSGEIAANIDWKAPVVAK